MNTSYLAVLGVPLVLVLALGRRLAARARLAVAVTAGATVTAGVVAYLAWIDDPSHLASVIVFFVFGLPLVTTPVAALVASRVINNRRDLPSTVIAALLGCIVGQVVVLLVFRTAAASGIVDAVYVVGSPAVYASCAAVVAAGLRGPTA